MNQVEKDIESAIGIIKGGNVDYREYRPVYLFPNHSLKHFKKYKLSNRDVLTRINSHAEIFDLLSYSANLSCYSSNRLDEYFLNLQLNMLDLEYKEFISYFLGYKGHRRFSNDTYNKIKDKLDDKTRYFFDELYKFMNGRNLFNSRLCDTRNISYDNIVLFIRYIQKNKYYKIPKDTPKFILCKDFSISLYFENKSFDVINLSYNVDNISEDKQKYIMNRIKKDIASLLKENGKIQVFTSKSGVDIEDLRKIETRSINDPNSTNESCKKDYAYMYRIQ